MKKVICLFLLLCICFTFSGCKTNHGAGQTPSLSPDNDDIIEGVNEQAEQQPAEQPVQQSEPDTKSPPPKEPIIDSVAPVEQEVLEYFESIHPGCSVSKDHNGYYTVVNDNVSIEQFKTEKLTQRQTDDGITRADLENQLVSDAPEWTAIFQGETTGRTRQAIYYSVWKSDESQQLTSYYISSTTWTEILVTEVYYGLPKAGDVIWVADFYGVVHKDGTKQLEISNGAKSNGLFEGKYLIHAFKEYIRPENNAYYLDAFGFALPLDREYFPQNSDEHIGYDYCIYQKYILDNDIALVRQQEIEKQIRFNEIFLSHAKEWIELGLATEQLKQEYDDVIAANGGVTEKQLQIIDDALKRYGEKE